MVQGTFDIAEETYILHFGGLEIMQEYVMYFTVPFSFFGFWLGILIEKDKSKQMSGWEIFTWLCTLILGLGSIVVFILFLFDLPSLLSNEQKNNNEI